MGDFHDSMKQATSFNKVTFISVNGKSCMIFLGMGKDEAVMNRRKNAE